MKFEINSEITFRKLEIFLAFVKTGNISRAAEILETTPVSVHRALHSLEEGLKCQLFRNEGRTLAITPAATLLAEAAREVIDSMSRGISLTRAAAGYSSGHLRLGALYSLTAEIAPKVIMHLKAKKPELNIELALGSNEELLDKLKRSQIDAILAGVPSESLSTMEVVPLFEDEIYFACSAEDLQNVKDEIDLYDYRDADFVSLIDGFVTYRGFIEACNVAGFTPKIVSQASDIFSLVSLVAAGVGVALLPGRVKDAIGNRIKLTPLQQRYRMRQTISLTFLHSREHDPTLLALAAVCRQVKR